jgi:hypothetical protein
MSAVKRPRVTRAQHNEAIRQAQLRNSAWIRDTAKLRDAVEEDDERYAIFLLRKLLRERKAKAVA